MAFNNSIPQPTDRIKDSQSALLANFQAIKTVIDINHVTFDDPSGDEGKHNYVSMPRQGAAPATGATEIALFSQLSTLSGATELVVRKESSGDEIEFTSALAANPGWARLPSGILLKWSAGNLANGAATYTWPTGATIPAFTNVFSVNVALRETVAGADKAIQLTSFSTTTVIVYGTQRTAVAAASTNYNIFAIGI